MRSINGRYEFAKKNQSSNMAFSLFYCNLSIIVIVFTGRMVFFMRFKFFCDKCDTTFTIDPKHMMNKKNVQCPSCDVSIPENILLELKSIATSIVNVYNNQNREMRSARSNNPNIEYIQVELIE